ncbi:hypothetical protein Tco_1337921 [Tanacetum coccineum]
MTILTGSIHALDELEHLKLVLKLLKKEELYAKFLKCDFWLSNVHFIDPRDDVKGIHVDQLNNEVWKVIQNGNSKKRVTKGKDGVYRVLPPTTQEEQFADEKERKARTLLLMAVPKDHLRRFHGMDDAKEIGQASRHGLVESLEKGYDRYQKLLSQLDALGAGVSDEDANHKFLRSLPPAWDSLAMTMRTKKNIDTLSIDDLYNNLSVFEQDIQKTSSSSLTSDNVAFLSQAKASSSKLKPSQSSGSYSSYATSSSKATKTATPGLADEVIHSFLATNADDVDCIHEELPPRSN